MNKNFTVISLTAHVDILANQITACNILDVSSKPLEDTCEITIFPSEIPETQKTYKSLFALHSIPLPSREKQLRCLRKLFCDISLLCAHQK